MSWPSISSTFQPKASVLVAQRRDLHDLGGAAVNLQLVAVHDGAEVVELVVRGGHGGLPDRALILLAIAQ